MSSSYNESMFNFDSVELNDIINSVEYELKHNNSDFIEICKKIERLKDKFPKIREMLEDEKASPLNAEESEELKNTINLYRKLLQLKYHGIFFRGGREWHNYYKKWELFKIVERVNF